MNTSESFEALRRANPRAKARFAQSVEAAADAVRTRIATAPDVAWPRRRLVHVSAAGATLAAVAAAAVFLMIGSPRSGPGVEAAAAAVERAATVTAASADRSGTAIVRITRDGELWAGKTVRWNGGDIAVSREASQRFGRVGGELLLVDGVLYGTDPEVGGGWLNLGSPDNIDPGSGTTPDDYLTAVREDTGGATLRRITKAMTGLTTHQLEDGSIVYRGAVPAGAIARETGFKEGQAIRVLPFGYVAHDEAANPAAPLDVAVTVGDDGVFREIAVSWGAGASAWTYTVTYSSLGRTAAPVAPANARPLRDRTPAGEPQSGAGD